MAIRYTLVNDEETSVLTAILNGQVYIAERSHANWERLVSVFALGTETDEDKLAKLFDVPMAIRTYFERVSGRVSLSNGHVYLDGEEVHSGLADAIIRFMSENNEDKALALVNFLEKVVTNPNEHSREQLYDWLTRYDFAINDEGNFLAYKGVLSRVFDPEASDESRYPYQSLSSGRATVDGQVFEGQIPQGIGSVVEMPRGDVQHDPSRGCHTGLHAGTWEYASEFTEGPVLLVEINPRDVVSVPTDCDWQKIRTCRYKVVEVIETKLSQSYWTVEKVADELDVDYAPEAPPTKIEEAPAAIDSAEVEDDEEDFCDYCDDDEDDFGL